MSDRAHNKHAFGFGTITPNLAEKKKTVRVTAVKLYFLLRCTRPVDAAPLTASAGFAEINGRQTYTCAAHRINMWPSSFFSLLCPAAVARFTTVACNIYTTRIRIFPAVPVPSRRILFFVVLSSPPPCKSIRARGSLPLSQGRGISYR